MTEALFYESKNENRVLCRLCPHNCLIGVGEKGFCGVRKNIEGKLYALTSGRIISAAVDPVEKKPLYHFYPGSMAYSLGGVGCNLACRHCQNHEISQNRDDETIGGLYKMSPERIIDSALEKNCRIIAWTYNEPTIWYEYIQDTAVQSAQRGLKTALITNGVINREPLEELLPLIDAYRVDIKGFSNDFYKKLTGFPYLKTVLQSAERAYNSHCHLELVTNIIPRWNDSDDQIDGLINWIIEKLDNEVPWHVTAYHPAYKMNESATSVQILENIYERGTKAGLKHIYLGNVYSQSGSDTSCPQCGTTLIRRHAMTMRENRLINRCCPGCGYKLKNFRE